MHTKIVSRIKNTLRLLLYFFAISSGYAQEAQDYRIIPSLTEWIHEVNNWPEPIYSQSRIKIYFDKEKDKGFIAENDDSIMEKKIDTIPRIVINKAIRVSELQFHNDNYVFDDVTLKNIHFKEEFSFYRLYNSRLSFKNCVFDNLHQVRIIKSFFYLNYFDCQFNDTFRLNNPEENVDLGFTRCTFKNQFILTSDQGIPNITLSESIFYGNARFGSNSHFNSLQVNNCTFKSRFVSVSNQIDTRVEIISSQIDNFNIDGTSLPLSNTYIPFNQISNKVALTYFNKDDVYLADELIDFENKEYYDRLIASYAKLLSVYKIRSESDSYNSCYVEMRKKQTAYSKFLYKKDETFSNYIVYQLNVFMGVFSDYGTKPTKAITFSIYVILLFAFIYLFFPNSWDKHGKNRIIDRYTFFMKYMNQNAGMHEVYLNDKKHELMAYNDFKAIIESSGKTVPKFFMITAIPLYNWAISGTKLAASFLKRIDIMKGTWSDLPQQQRFWKSIPLVGAFIITIIYDLCIKMLNALMLSINTFTTLGFGEIPIKGLPRYLAIIQGFIGWFMLTIFSVSLISQLLN